MESKIEIKGGTQRSWDREVGYGVVPGWYQESQTVTLDIQEVDLTEIIKQHETT